MLFSSFSRYLEAWVDRRLDCRIVERLHDLGQGLESLLLDLGIGGFERIVEQRHDVVFDVRLWRLFQQQVDSLDEDNGDLHAHIDKSWPKKKERLF